MTEDRAAESPGERDSAPAAWPPLPGEFVLGNQASPVAVSTLATQSLLPKLAGRPEIAIAGRVYTENVGIEKMVQNLLAAPHLRFLLLCGRESRHRVGQAILSLHRNGIDPVTKRIRGATGPEPVLPNLREAEIAAFQQQFQVVDLIGEQDAERILEAARACQAGGEKRGSIRVAEQPAATESIWSEPDPSGAWIYDPAGFFLIRTDRSRGRLLVEHYDQDRRLRHRLEGETAQAVSQTAIRLGLVTDLNHAAYLGRELTKAEVALKFGLQYEQDSLLHRGLGDGS